MKTMVNNMENFKNLPKQAQSAINGIPKGLESLNCSEISRSIKWNKAYKRIRQKMDKDVKTKKCPPSLNPNSKENHEDEIKKSQTRIDNLKNMKKYLNCKGK